MRVVRKQAGQIQFKLNQRRIETPEAFLNRITPTRGTKVVVRTITSLASEKETGISVTPTHLYDLVTGIKIPHSKHRARLLKRAGVTSIIIPKDALATDIKTIIIFLLLVMAN